MKVVLLAGGKGTRISEESLYKPKPMVEIGGMPILWHIMKEFSFYGFNDFIICAGYKQEYIKTWFSNYYVRTNDVSFDFRTNSINILHQKTEPWTVTIVDTGLDTDTGGRIERVRKYINDDTFIVTYGDGVGDINIAELVQYHNSKSEPFTITTYPYTQNKGVIEQNEQGLITAFREKSKEDNDPINIGYMVLNTEEFFKYPLNDKISLEKGPITYYTNQGLVNGYTHKGFWQCMDTLREKNLLENMWESGNAPWKLWEG